MTEKKPYPEIKNSGLQVQINSVLAKYEDLRGYL